MMPPIIEKAGMDYRLTQAEKTKREEKRLKCCKAWEGSGMKQGRTGFGKRLLFRLSLQDSHHMWQDVIHSDHEVCVTVTPT